MRSVQRLVPSPVRAFAHAGRRLGGGFGPRFFVALLLGLVWLGPAWWSPRFLVAMFVWDALLLAVWLWDLLRLPSPRQLELRRVWHTPPSLGVPGSVTVELYNGGRVGLHGRVVDEVPRALRGEAPMLELKAGPGKAGRAEYSILPGQRGDAPVGRLFVRYQSPLRLAERWAVAECAQSVRVLPNLEQARHHTLFLIRSHQVEMERRRKRQRGIGREFESLREYREGDELRNVSWTATARRHRLITKIYQVERSQAVWIVVDAGRLLRAQIRQVDRPMRLSKLDYAVDAALTLAQVAMHCGDRVGLVAYGREIQQSLNAGRGPLHLRALVEALAQVRGEPYEANHGRAAHALLAAQKQRSLMVWITDLAETATLPEVIEYALQMTSRHLVVFGAMGQPDLTELVSRRPNSEEEMYRYIAALEIVQRRELLLRRLRQQGALALELMPGAIASSLVNQYLEIKERSML